MCKYYITKEIIIKTKDTLILILFFGLLLTSPKLNLINNKFPEAKQEVMQTFGEDLVVVNDQITLLFVKTNDGWKMVHEHHSHLNKE